MEEVKRGPGRPVRIVPAGVPADAYVADVTIDKTGSREVMSVTFHVAQAMQYPGQPKYTYDAKDGYKMRESKDGLKIEVFRDDGITRVFPLTNVHRYDVKS